MDIAKRRFFLVPIRRVRLLFICLTRLPNRRATFTAAAVAAPSVARVLGDKVPSFLRDRGNRDNT